MADLSQDEIEKLKASHPGVELHFVTAGIGEREVSVIVKVPNRERWNRFKSQVGDPHRKAMAFESLVRDCVVHPSAGELDRLLEQRPGLAEAFGGKLTEIAGLEESVAARKL